MLARLVLLFTFVMVGLSPAGADVQNHTNGAPASASFGQLIAEAKKVMMAEPNVALAKGRDLVGLARSRPASRSQQKALGMGLRIEVEALTRTNRLAEARAVLSQAQKIIRRNPSFLALDGDIALSAGRLAQAYGDYGLALKSYQHAYQIYAKLGARRGQSFALQGLGMIYGQARDFAQEISYYNRAAEVYSGEPPLQLAIENNIGTAYQYAGQYDKAFAHFNSALTVARNLKSPFLEARILTNIAFVQVKLRRYSDAQKAAEQALALLGKADENGWAPFVWGVMADIQFQSGSLTTAAKDLDKAFRGVDLTKTIAPFRDIHELAYKIYSAMGNYPLALAHLKAFKRLDDEGRSLAASTNLALMNARFNFANQKLEIEHLKTEQIRKEANLKESRAATQRVLLLSLISVAVLIIIWISWRHRLVTKHRDVISRANTELTRILGERDQEIVRRIETESHLRVAMEAAEQANRAKTQFLANMSHELRTPLNAIIGFSEIIMSGIVPQDRAQEYSADINASGKKLLITLNDILDTARLDAGSVSLTEEEVNLGKVVEKAMAKVGCDNDLKGKDIHFTGDKSLRLRGDNQRLVQIIEKLVSNAAKFTGADGKIEITLQAAEDGGIDLTVSDDGIGIAPEQIAHILDRFGQIESAYARSHGGIGLGLPIVKSLVALHGGTLHLESEVEKGTTARVHFPAERRLSPLPQEKSSETAAA